MHSNGKKFLIGQISREKIVVRKLRLRTRRLNCAVCGAETEMLALDSAVTLSRIRTRDILNLVEKELLHAVDTASGHIFVCRRSLENFK